MKSRKPILAAVFALTALPLHAAVSTGDIIGTTEADITAALEAQGYVVGDIEREDDEIEVEITLDGEAFEIELSAATGVILEVEADDDDDDND